VDLIREYKWGGGGIENWGTKKNKDAATKEGEEAALARTKTNSQPHEGGRPQQHCPKGKRVEIKMDGCNNGGRKLGGPKRIWSAIKGGTKSRREKL